MGIIEKNVQKLLTAMDGVDACNAINALCKNATENSREQVIQALMQYAETGRIVHMQSFALARMVSLVQEQEINYMEFFKSCIESKDKSKCYWGIGGYCKVMKKASFDYLLETLFSKQMILENKALIVKKLSELSNTPFDANKPYECIHWKEEDMEYDRIRIWAQSGYPDGNGYDKPHRHECLDNPKSVEEKLYARLDKKLLKKREKKQDLAHPSNWLIRAEQSELDDILQKWALPQGYIDFLEKASPLKVDFRIKGFGNVCVYGAHELIQGQAGYSYNSTTNTNIATWNSNYVVIAQRFGDPFCIDISQANSPVYFAEHGMGKWEFTKEFDSFIEFLKNLA